MHIKKTVKYDVGNAYPGMGQGIKYCAVGLFFQQVTACNTVCQIVLFWKTNLLIASEILVSPSVLFSQLVVWYFPNMILRCLIPKI